MVLPIQRIRELLAPTYTIDRELGRGGMATVCLAQDTKHERVVALKVLHPGLAESVGPERFLREIKVVARLNHPHILPLFDSGEVHICDVRASRCDTILRGHDRRVTNVVFDPRGHQVVAQPGRLAADLARCLEAVVGVLGHHAVDQLAQLRRQIGADLGQAVAAGGTHGWL